MKKFSILIAAVALMAMTACNEKPAKNADQNAAPATEQTQNAKADKAPDVKVDVERAKPTEDGKDHTVGEFKTKDYQVRLENLADGTYRVSLWKAGRGTDGAPDQVGETKKCVMKDNNYLMQTEDGKTFIISTVKGNEQITIMNDEGIIYNGKAQ